MKKIIAIAVLGILNFSAATAEKWAPPPGGQRKLLRTSAYYSPLPDQKKYFRGNFAAETRLNGRGTHGADGTPVFPGMIAAPSNYPFGTKIFIPGLGVGEVHDRGGAIVRAGERGQNFDRVDLWMGRGDAGLLRALAWGKRNVEAVVYFPFEKKMPPTDFSFDDLPLATFVAATKNFARNFSEISAVAKFFPAGISRGSRGKSVKNLQKFLAKNGFYDGEISGVFDDKTENAVFAFQKAKKIVSKKFDRGAGVFGPRTQTALFSLLTAREKVLRGEKKPKVLVFEKIGKSPAKKIVKNPKKPEKTFAVKNFPPRKMPPFPAAATLKKQKSKMLFAEF